jgi:hypothetical protein
MDWTVRPLPPLQDEGTMQPAQRKQNGLGLWIVAISVVICAYMFWRNPHSGWVTNSIRITVIVCGGLTLAGAAFVRWEVRRVARRILYIRKHLTGRPAVFVDVKASDFPQLDVEFYNNGRVLLESFGFRFVADQEGLHLTKAVPRCRTMVRRFLSEDGTIRATIYNMDLKGSYDLTSELLDGRIVETSNTLGRARGVPIPGCIKNRQPRETEFRELLRQHRETLERIKDSRPVVMNDLAELMASSTRENDGMRAFKWRADFDEAAELREIRGRELNAMELLVAQEVTRLKVDEFKNVTVAVP